MISKQYSVEIVLTRRLAWRSSAPKLFLTPDSLTRQWRIAPQNNSLQYLYKRSCAVVQF